MPLTSSDNSQQPCTSVIKSPHSLASRSEDNPSPRSECGRLLPEECLQQIFEHLAQDLSSLHSLLLVSRTFFRIVLPLLYSSPFDLLESNLSCSSQERTQRHASLLYLLMNCCSLFRADEVPQQEKQEPSDNDTDEEGSTLWKNIPPVSVAFEVAHQSLKKPLVDYLSAYHHHYLCMNLSRTFPLLFPNLQRHDPTPQPSPANTPRLVGDNRITSKPPGTTTITMLTRNEIERTIMQHRPHFIRTMSLPVQRLPAFQSIGPRLASLVRFELYGISWHFNLDPAIAFLREHAACYGTIRELKMAGPNDVRLLQKPKLHDVIKTIKHPKLIDLSRYKEATRDLNSFEIQNMDGLEHLFFDLDFVPVPAAPQVITTTAAEAPGTSSSTSTLTITFPILDQAMDSAKNDALDLIRQCTRLTTLHIGVRSSTMFAWAVDCYNFDPASLQQLKVLHLSSNRTIIVKQVLDDCLYAFRDTLEDLKGIALKLSPNPSPMSFGWTWPLQQLSVLSLKGELAAWFDFESLRYCPKLTEICLTLNPYSPPKTDHLEKLVLASQLATLSLLGRWIVSDTLMAHVGEGLQRLKKLTLEGCQDDALTGEGLIEGLEKMKALRRLDIGLGASVEVAVREYRETRPGLDITMRSDDLPRL